MTKPNGNSKAIIYGLRAVASADYFYVGSTKFSPEHRLAQHLYAVKGGRQVNRHLAHKIMKIGIDNLVIDVLEETDCEHRWGRELAWIEKFNNEGVKLVNLIYNGPYSVAIDYQEQYALEHPMTIEGIACGVSSILIENGYPDDPSALQRTSEYTHLPEHLLIDWYQRWRPKDKAQVAAQYRELRDLMLVHGVAALREMFERFPDETQSDIRGLIS